jgi:DNA-binding PadR family transcriptional regulator
MWPFKFAMRRKRGLPHMIVYLLGSSPKNGVELMDGVESITRGWWRPTPGSIYPLLKEMTDQGILKKLDDGRYELTEKGRAQMRGPFGPPFARPRSTGDVVSQMHSFVSYMEDVKTSQADELEPHRGRLRELAKRLSELAEGDEGDKPS